MSCSAHHIDDRAHQHADVEATQRPHLERFPQELRDLLQDVASKQETLAKSREDLVIERQRLISSRNQVRAKRLETRDAEAGLMSCLRNLMNDVQQKIPASLLESYHRVDTLRNELGILEEEFLLAERKFAGSEWGFMDEENDFYQFELLDVIEDAVSGGASPLHDHEQIFVSKGSTSEPLEPEATSVPATPSHSLPDYIPDSEGVVRSNQHVPPPPPPLFLHNAQSYPSQPVVERSIDPPPLVKHSPPQDVSTGSSARLRDYHTVIDELEALRRSFEKLRHERTEVLNTIEDDPASISSLGSIGSEDNNTIQPAAAAAAAAAIEQQPFFQILQQISDREIEATRLKNEAMFNEIQLSAITRRYSDPTNIANTVPTPSIFMSRALSETAVPMLSNDSGAKGRLREWLLAQLKEDPLQRRMYRNILMYKGLQTPADETWEDRASSYWNIDHASDGDMETIDSYDEDEEYTITRATSHDPSAIPFSMVAGYQAYPSNALHDMRGKMGAISTGLPHRAVAMSPITVLPKTEDATAAALTSGLRILPDPVLSRDEQTQNPEHNWSFNLPQPFKTDVAATGVTDRMSKQHDSYSDLSAMKEPLSSSILPTIITALAHEEFRTQHREDIPWPCSGRRIPTATDGRL
jgi:hypothetical protein